MNSQKYENKISEGSKKLINAELKGELLSYGKSLKVQLVLSTILFVIAIVIAMAFVMPFLNPEKPIDWANLFILIALIIYGLVVGRLEGYDWSITRKNGLYRYTLKQYDEVYNAIEPIRCFLIQYCDFLFVRKRKEYYHKILINWGIDDERVLDLSTDELHELIGKHYRKSWLGDEKYPPSRHAYKYREGDLGKGGKNEPYISYFDPYTEEQVKVIKGCITGYFKLEKLPASYFEIPEYNRTKDAYINAQNSGKQKNKITVTTFISRILTLLVFSIVLSTIDFTVYEQGSMADIMGVIIDTFTRIFTLISGLMFGFYTGCEVAKIDQYYLSFKVETLRVFKQEYEKGIFNPMNKAEQRIKEYEEEQEEIRKAVESVVTPELVNDSINKSRGIEYKGGNNDGR